MKDAGFTESVFADDLNAFKELDVGTAEEEVFSEARKCQTKLHSWGRANQVVFEATKESCHILSHLEPAGEDFKLLGVDFDCALTMAGALYKLVGKARWKLHALLKSSAYHTEVELVELYKTKLLGYLEYRTAAFYHVTCTTLQPMNRILERNRCKQHGGTDAV